ncbi:MAG: glutaminyl-peptide cyclotransferase [Acidobacteriota bacterium]|nr:glutaminyl-peptide cyclotransferase [Acidobacteriota bacterium]
MSPRGRLLLGGLAVAALAGAVMLLSPAGSETVEEPGERSTASRQQTAVASSKASTRASERAATPAPVERLRVRAVAEYPHDPGAYTQGLLWHGGELYESTGLHGRSSVRRVNLKTGQLEHRFALAEHLFGEGLALVGERLFLLTWQAETGFILDRESFEEIGRFSYRGEGWGLCYDGERLIFSDGQARLRFFDPEGFAPLGEMPVTLEGRPQRGLNELECVDGMVYANIYGADSLVRIDPRDGRVTGVIDASGLLDPRARAAAEVLNGIAYRPETGTWLLTGKLWPKVFEVLFEPIP